MTRNLSIPSLPRTAVTAVLGPVLAALTMATLLVPSSAQAHHPRSGRAVPAPPANPTNDDQIQNVDTRQAPARQGHEGDPARLRRHLAEHLQLRDLAQLRLQPHLERDVRQRAGLPRRVRDTRPRRQGAVARVQDLLPDRPAEAQRAATEDNLAKVSFPAVDSQVYLKDQTKPWLPSCAPTCTTIQYKSLTRKYIESQGNDILANFGDQFSDLSGGYADKTYKLPNPMYYLP